MTNPFHAWQKMAHGARVQTAIQHGLTLLCPARLRQIVQHVEDVVERKVPGTIAEFGTYRGGAALLMAMTLHDRDHTLGREVTVYDTFAGLPMPTEEDDGTPHKAGDFAARATDLAVLFESIGLGHRLSMVAGDARETASGSGPIAFAHVDLDLYDSTKAVLEVVVDRLSPGGVVVVDDYGRGSTPGVEKAVHEVLQDGVMAGPSCTCWWRKP